MVPALIASLTSGGGHDVICRHAPGAGAFHRDTGARRPISHASPGHNSPGHNTAGREDPGREDAASSPGTHTGAESMQQQQASNNHNQNNQRRQDVGIMQFIRRVKIYGFL
ncbi:hypothetical protein ThrDRAFT_01384 [Frankia casuarinae]|uniref:Uncharacterized protein n=2 Tax=Frankia TaxID=1854 RepID=Q2JG33_FRACC|nr:hypothetical protein Francci3_0372 [Frankia casuarinae]ETA02260.1 hypothetical protein CcI6DRAFT_02249 [Frankia sp. CcI6]EYT93001.1 hypothetical protein ThrDRAFT_01384 [Frankia casuarinae]KFB03548.1 hypothetical protein ALLO2DRAFT_03700 [Frankia sp. Allo2]